MSKRPPSASSFLSHIAYDLVIFGFDGDQLNILILEYHNTGFFALPGGFLKRDEDLDRAAYRGLRERTGIDSVYLEQFHTFGSVERYQPEIMDAILRANDFEDEPDHWMLDRFISVAYFALINFDEVEPRPDLLSDSIRWYPVTDLPELMLDHNLIVQTAREHLRSNLYSRPVGKNLLPDRFTMKELQQVHEAILGVPLRRTSFQRKILSMDILERHEKRFTGKAHKAPYQYSFKTGRP